jgi:minor extracellular serine protease Vpr
LRRPLILSAAFALVVASSASAKLAPVRWPTHETGLARVRTGTIVIPAGHATGTTRVIVQLAAPPLAVWNSRRTLASAAATQHLNVHSRASQAYVAKLERAQATAMAEVRAVIPQAKFQERFSILLDGFTVQLPETSLPKLVRMKFATHVYPSFAYYAASDPGPSVIRATDLASATGAQGQGMKIGVVDTGVDTSNPFLNPAGFSYPAGFPKGDPKLTTPKVIVAKVFPGPARDKLSNKAFDPSEPHGTHVSGIAAGDENTTAPSGPDHPQVTGLTGVAPKAWIGNYRVFTVPTPLGHEGDTPEIVKAFEAAVADGMNVINFSGGGPQTDPANDAFSQAVRNVVLAGVVPVVAAGNDRDDYGLGTVGSPASVPEAIAVAATSTGEVYANAMSITGGPAALGDVPLQTAAGEKFPGAWSTLDQTLVEASSVTGTDGKPVDKYLCGGSTDPNGGAGTLPKGSLTGKIVLAYRGFCSFASKSLRADAAGAAGMILIDNRFGEANEIPVQLAVPGGMIADLDGANLAAYMDTNGGQAKFRVSGGFQEIETGRSGVIASFSSAGPTSFGYDQKPDISAPGLDVLSSTPPLTTGSTFAVFSGTSMATPHVAGAAALLLELHPGWSVAQVKSALMSTAGAAWQNTARTQEASVLLEGSGLANVSSASNPLIFTDPQSLSFHKIDVSPGDRRTSQLLTLSDAGGGSGTWSVSVAPQAQTSGVQIGVPATVSVPPGGFMGVPVTVSAPANAGLGENYGFIVLTMNGVSRRVPYSFLVEKPALADVPATPLQKLQSGDTAVGPNRVSVYCCPAAPFGPPADFLNGAPMNEDGSEHLYSIDLREPVANFGVSILAEGTGAVVDPFVLGSKDENDVQGYAGIPTNVNSLMYDANVDEGVAGASFPRVQGYYVSVDSATDEFTHRSQKGKYILNAWVNDLTPPAIQILTTRVTAGRPLIAAFAGDLQSGVDPLSLVVAYKNALIGASAYDPATGLVLFGIPDGAPPLKAGKTTMIMQASDFQETKNIDSAGADILPNTAFQRVKLTVVAGPSVSWLIPPAGECLGKKQDELAVLAASTTKVKQVTFADNGKTIAVQKAGEGGIYVHAFKTAGLKKGKHLLTATVLDEAGKTSSAGRLVRVCR